MNNTIDVTMLSDAELVARERQALQAWIDASATSAAARAHYRGAVQAGLDTSAAREMWRAEQAAERAAQTAHQALSDALVRRNLVHARVPSAA